MHRTVFRSHGCDDQHKEDTIPFGKIAGLAVGIFVAHYLILPQGVIQAVQSRSIASTGLVHLLFALVITIVAMGLFHFLDRR